MARTPRTPGGGHCALPTRKFTASSRPMASSLLASNDVVEIRLGNKKIVLCPPLVGDEDKAKRAMTFYTANAALTANARDIPHRTRLIALGNHTCLVTIVNLTLERIDYTYDVQKWDHSR